MLKNREKMIKNADFLSENANIFKCPICSSQMQIVDSKSLICTNHHCFDIARRGYINFLSHAHKTKYNKQMFNFRNIISKNGFFAPLTQQISKVIINTKPKNSPIKILDAGCGEGSHLSNILEKAKQNAANNLLGVGMDISKEGIYIASREYPHSIWCVADIAQCPFANKQFNFIVNILSPSNYSEFQRMLADDGMIIKVIPGSQYLQELRKIFYAQTDKQVYSSNKIINLFRNHLDLQDMQQLKYRIDLDNTLIKPLVYMTPLSWGVTEERMQKVLEMSSAKITIDLIILIGRKRRPLPPKIC